MLAGINSILDSDFRAFILAIPVCAGLIYEKESYRPEYNGGNIEMKHNMRIASTHVDLQKIKCYESRH